MRDEKPGICCPRVDAKPTFLANILEVIPVEDLKMKAKPALKLLAPLQQHRGRTGDDYLSHFLAEKELPSNQPCLYRFPEADIVRNEQIDAG